MAEVALIVGGGPGVSGSCARLFANEGFKVAIAARTPDKPELVQLAEQHGISTFACDASDPDSVQQLFSEVTKQLGVPKLVVHNIDGRSRDVFRKPITDVAPHLVLDVIKNSTYSAFLVGQQAAKHMLANDQAGDHKGTILYTNASAALKGYPLSGAFAAASHGKDGLAQSMARELMPQGIHVAHIPIDCAIGNHQQDGGRAHWAAGVAENDNMADPDKIAELYLQLHRQHKSTWAFEVVLRPWVEKW